MTKNKELLLWKWKDCSRHSGTMHWCAVALGYLISALRYNKITFMLLIQIQIIKAVPHCR